MRLIDAETLKKRIQLAPNKQNETWTELYDAVMYEIDNAPSVEVTKPQSYVMVFCDGLEAQTYEKPPMFERPQGDCEKCDFRKFTETFIDGVVDVMNKNGITSVEQLSKILEGGAE